MYTTKRKIPTGDFLAGSSPLLLDSKLAFYNRLLLVVAGLGGLLYGVDLGIIAGAVPYLEAASELNTGAMSISSIHRTPRARDDGISTACFFRTKSYAACIARTRCACCSEFIVRVLVGPDIGD